METRVTGERQRYACGVAVYRLGPVLSSYKEAPTP